jgi:2-polyprenyl-3-methyl-5-hydroxy-6-metoxy-1,4-benzoquinol methylase
VEATSSSADDWLRLNRAWWDERAPVHAASGFYDVPGFLAGQDSLRAFEPEEVGDVRGKRLLHLMCHIGLDTLSWARRGAIVTGLDFSRPALDTAVSVAGRAGIGSARFVAAEIGEASQALAGETFDVVYTGTGVTQWIPDIGSWACTVAALVAPGGFFYIADYHPFPDSFDIVDGEVRGLRHGYLDHGPWAEQAAGSYTGPAETSANTFMKWSHHIGSVVNALAAAGLRIEFLHEYDFTDAPFPGLERGADGLWRIPAGRFGIPLMFSLRAAKDPPTVQKTSTWSSAPPPWRGPPASAAKKVALPS